ncbi:hypothetical protein ACFO5K_10570 [Nocardia halotolerans]|uniref:Uncharacterized protein n=1 Tax=Nocardia halotolerans TaxID=1755878 RepID=A0ABV8VHM3_9NOCA
MWEPGSTWSPGTLDAGVHLATNPLPPIGQAAKTSSIAKHRCATAGGGGAVTSRRTR